MTRERPAKQPGCSATTKDGAPCPKRRQAGSVHCVFHDPAISKEARSAGGRARAKRPALSAEEAARVIKLGTPREASATLEATAQAVASGRLDVATANAIGVLAGNAIRAHVAEDELAERAHKRRAGLSDEQVAETLRRMRAVQQDGQVHANGRGSASDIGDDGHDRFDRGERGEA